MNVKQAQVGRARAARLDCRANKHRANKRRGTVMAMTAVVLPVLAILAAFAIDAWWDEVRERDLEAEQLSRLHAEFSNNLRLMDSRYFRSLRREALGDVLDLAEAQVAALPAEIDIPVLLLMRILNAATFEVESPVLDGLIRSGGLEIVEDREVVTALASWDRGVRNYIELAQRARRNSDTLLFPALAARGSISALVERESSTYAREQFLNGEPDPDHVVQIRVDEELLGLLALGYNDSRVTEFTLSMMQNYGQDVLAAIEATGLELDVADAAVSASDVDP